MLPLLLGGAMLLSLAFVLAFDAVAFPAQRVFAVQRLDRSLARSRRLLATLDRSGPGLEKDAHDIRQPQLTPLEGRS
jgi:hypothetical protein